MPSVYCHASIVPPYSMFGQGRVISTKRVERHVFLVTMQVTRISRWS